MPGPADPGHGAPRGRPLVAPRIGAGDRLGATLALSLIIHGIVLLGIGFAAERSAPLLPTLDVILVETRDELPPDQADFLAQASQRGGGESETPERPRERLSSETPRPEPGVAPQPLQAQAPPPQPTTSPRVITSSDGELAIARPEDTPEQLEERLPTGETTVQQSLEMARLAAEIERQAELLARRPSRKFVSASTREYEYAGYMRSWVTQVERVGNLNYPEEARRRQLTGRLMMTVAVRRDGSVESIDIVNPSGYPILDQAAVRVVRLAEPFPPLPRTDANPDVLHITRTWEWTIGGRLRDQ